MREVELDSTLREMILKHHKKIRNLLVTDSQVEIINLAGNGIRTNELADQLDVSVQNASSRLNKLFWRGYLNREQTIAPSGGIEYIYSSKY